MRITLIAAMAREARAGEAVPGGGVRGRWVIGRDGGLPWRLPADLKRFKQLTLGKPVLMGRRTWHSVWRALGGALPGRTNIVLSRDPALVVPPDVLATESLVRAVQAARDTGAAELMVMGGATLYEQLLPRAHRMELTFVDADLEGDTWFPEWDPEEWRETAREEHPADERNAYACAFVTRKRV